MKCHQVFYDFGYCLLETENIKKKSSMTLKPFPFKGRSKWGNQETDIVPMIRQNYSHNHFQKPVYTPQG